MSAKTGKRSGSFLLRILIVVFCTYLIYTLGSLFAELNSSKAELAAIEAQAAQTQANIDELNNLLEQGTEEEIIEKAARDRLGYVYADEQVYVDISGN